MSEKQSSIDASINSDFQNIDLKDDGNQDKDDKIIKVQQQPKPTTNEYLEHLSKQLMNDYAKYFELKPTAQIAELNEILENLLTHMEEFYGLIEQIRNNNNQYLDQYQNILMTKTDELRKLFAFIDKLERIVNHVHMQISLMEQEVIKAEKMMKASTAAANKTSTVKKLFSILSGNQSTSPSTTNEWQSKYCYIPQEIFRTEDLLKM